MSSNQEKGFKNFKDRKRLGKLQSFHLFHSPCIYKVPKPNEFRYLKTWTVSKVEDSWKTTEFVVLPHRDSKDVFILGGTDDIQVGNWVTKTYGKGSCQT